MDSVVIPWAGALWLPRDLTQNPWVPKGEPLLSWVSGLRPEGKLEKDSYPPMCGQEEGKRGQTGRKEAE